MDENRPAGNQEFHVHKPVMAANSTFFLDLFLQDNEIDKIVIEDVSADMMREVIRYCYDFKVYLYPNIIYDLAAAGARLQVTDLIRTCTTTLYEKITPSSCLNVLMMTHEYRYLDYYRPTLRYCARVFQEIKDGEEFKALREELLSDLLMAPELDVVDEGETALAIVTWVSAYRDERFSRLEPLLNSCVKTNLWTEEQLRRLECNKTFTDYSSICLCFIWETRRQRMTDGSLFKVDLSNNRYRPFTPRSRLEVGRQHVAMALRFNELRQFELYDPTKNKTILIPTPAQVGSIYTLLSNYIYAFKNGPSEESCRYDIEKKVWLFDVAEQYFERQNYFVVSLNNNVYAIGSAPSSTKVNRTKRVHRYDAKENTWTEVAPMNSGDGSVIIGAANLDGLIYVLKEHMEYYDPNTDEWIQIATKNFPRKAVERRHFIAKWNSLYGVASEPYRREPDQEVRSEVICFEPESRRWRGFEDPTHSIHYLNGVVDYKNNLYYYDGQTVQFYNPTDRWRVIGR